MKILLVICLTLSLILPAAAQESKPKVLGIYYFSEMRDHLVKLDGQSCYKFENTNNMPYQVQLLKIVRPPLSNTVYKITGKIKYNNVDGDGYLEMWSYFPSLHPGTLEKQDFSRTLADSGGLQKITGTCEWRDFSLPFDPTSDSASPTRLEINLILPGHGTVYLTPVRLWRYPAGYTLFPVTGSTAAWWSINADTLIAFIGAPVSACLGILLGTLAGKGKARRLVLGTWRCCIAAGILCLIASLVAFKIGQPDYVRGTLLIYGIIYTIIFSAIWPTAKRRYREQEIRRMESMDATGL